jgi:hypothetical protein
MKTQTGTEQLTNEAAEAKAARIAERAFWMALAARKAVQS